MDKTYEVFKRIDFSNTLNYEPLAKEGIYCYILIESPYNKRYLFLYHKELYKGTKFTKKELIIHNIKLNRILYFYKDKKNKIRLFQSDDPEIKPKPIYRQKILPSILFFKRYLLDKDLENDNKLNVLDENFYTKDLIDTNHIITYNHEWLKKEIENNIDYYNPKKYLHKVLNKSKLDKKLIKSLITEFYYFDPADTHLLPHSIILTNGKTGKTSILGRVGVTIDNLSDAGLFGYYDTKTSYWKTGIAETCESTILIDEINEIIKKKQKLFETLNRPLENGEYFSGKAGNKSIKINNQFILLGNISPNFNFEQFVFNLSNNILTAGRRFGYIVYDENVNFKNGGLRSNYEHLGNELMIFKEILSTLFLSKFKEFKLYKYFTDDKKINKLKNILNKYLPEINKILDELNDINAENTYIFLKEFRVALLTRTFYMALQITFFNNFLDIVKNKLERRVFIEKTYSEYNEILDIITQSIKNILEHIQNNNIKLNYKYIDLEGLSERHLLFIYYIYKRKDEIIKYKHILFENYSKYINNKKFYYQLRDIRDKIVNKNVNTYKQTIENIGLSYSITPEKQIKIVLLNNETFTKFIDYFEKTEQYNNLDNNNNSEPNQDKKTERDIILEEIDLEDL